MLSMHAPEREKALAEGAGQVRENDDSTVNGCRSFKGLLCNLPPVPRPLLRDSTARNTFVPHPRALGRKCLKPSNAPSLRLCTASSPRPVTVITKIISFCVIFSGPNGRENSLYICGLITSERLAVGT